MSILFKNIFSAEFIYMWIRVVTPILLPALGAAICNRAGVVNLGLEGIMLMSALGGVLGSAFGGSLIWGLVGGVTVGLVMSLLFAYFHLHLGANAVLCGTAINTFAAGMTVLVLQVLTGEKGTSASLRSFSFPSINIPIIEDIPILGSILSGHNLMTYVAFLGILFVWFLFYKTPLGLRIRSVGETPAAASSVGVNVRKIRYIAILLCGVLCSLGGMYMSMGYLNIFTRDMIAGRGYIALAAAAMGQSTPLGVLFSSMLFAFFDGLSNTLQLLNIPSQFIEMLPYVATIVGLTVYSIRCANVEKKHKLALS
ncbi:MAG: ABC transporter permease [Pseudoflavonifractor sp.]